MTGIDWLIITVLLLIVVLYGEHSLAASENRVNAKISGILDCIRALSSKLIEQADVTGKVIGQHKDEVEEQLLTIRTRVATACDLAHQANITAGKAATSKVQEHILRIPAGTKFKVLTKDKNKLRTGAEGNA